MVNHPIKVHDYHTKVINSREEFIKEFEKKYGRKKGFSFFRFETEKEKLV